MKHFTNYLLVMLFLCFGILTIPVNAQVSPQYSTGSLNASSGNSIPFAYSSSGCRGQYLYPANVFSPAAPSGMAITKLYWAAYSGSTGSSTYSQLHISLKQANTSSLTTTYETGMTQVFSSTNHTISYTGGNWFVIELTTPFPYDPTLPIIFEVNQLQNPLNNFYCALSTQGTPTGAYRNYSTSYNASSASGAGPYMISFGFDLEPVSTAKNDIGVTVVDSPSVFCDGPHNVGVTVKNFGINQVDTFTVNWTFNGQLQTPVTYYTLLDTFNGANSNSAYVTLGTKTFTANKVDSIVAWTSMPNNVQDTVNDNDTAMGAKRPSIYGNFTINPSGTGANNYVKWSDLAKDLSDYGVCGPINVAVKAGTYNEQVSFDKIEGTSAANYIHIYPDSGAVTLEYSASSTSDNYVIKLNSASWISFTDFTIDAKSSSYATVISMDGGSSYNSFENCIFNGYSNATTSTYQAILYTYSAGNNYNRFINNEFNGGSYGTYFYGGGTTSTNIGNEFIGNSFLNQYYRPAMFYYTTDHKFNHNFIRTNSTYSSMYAVMMYYGYDNAEVIGNDVNVPGYMGLYLYYLQGGNNGKPLIANNMVRIGKMIGSTGYGIYCYGGGYCRIVNNTVAMDHSSYTYYGMYIQGGANTVMNNIIHDRTGYSSTSYACLYVNGGFSLIESDYNNFYTNRQLGYLSGGFSTLAAWQNGTGFDMHSLTTDPGFNTLDTLRTCSDSLEGAGTPLAYVTDDFDGDGRHPTTPDIGADEFVGSKPGSYSAGPDAITCAGKPATIGLPVSNSLFSWNTGDTTAQIIVSQAGTYTVSMTSSCGASHMDTVEVTDITPVAAFDVNSVFLTGDFKNQSTNDVTRMWVVDVITDADTFYTKDLTYVFPDNGPYNVTLYIYNDCDTDMVTHVWTGWVGIEENNLENMISLMPNPVSDVLSIRFDGLEGDVTVEMTNIQGQVVHSDRYMNVAGNNTATIDVNSLRKGMYIVKFITVNGVATKQVVVK